MTATQQLGGSLQVLGVPDALQMISSAGKTGVLRFAFTDSSLDLRLAFKDGRVGGLSGKSVPRLSEVLLRQGVSPVTVGQLGLSLAKSGDTSVLQTLGRDVLERALEERLVIGLQLIWKMRNGNFEFVPTDNPPISLDPGLKLDSASLEVARRVDELDWDVPVMLSPLTVYAVAERIGDFTDRISTLTNSDWSLLNLLDGESTLAQIGLQAVLPWDVLARGISALEAAGLIEPALAQRGIQPKYTRLKRGDIAPGFSLPALDGSLFSLGSLRGRRTLLAFHRHAGCPFCNLRVHQLIQAYPRLQNAGVRVVAVFGSTLDGLRERVGKQKPPFALLADPDDTIHALYGTNRSLLGLLDPRAMPKWVEGFRLGIQHGSTDGEATRMPADFLIGTDLRIEAALYGANAAEHVSVPDLERWGLEGKVPG
jgi:peroxiredoxin